MSAVNETLDPSRSSSRASGREEGENAVDGAGKPSSPAQGTERQEDPPSSPGAAAVFSSAAAAPLSSAGAAAPPSPAGAAAGSAAPPSPAGAAAGSAAPSSPGAAARSPAGAAGAAAGSAAPSSPGAAARSPAGAAGAAAGSAAPSPAGAAPRSPAGAAGPSQVIMSIEDPAGLQLLGEQLPDHEDHSSASTPRALGSSPVSPASLYSVVIVNHSPATAARPLAAAAAAHSRESSRSRASSLSFESTSGWGGPGGERPATPQWAENAHSNHARIARNVWEQGWQAPRPCTRCSQGAILCWIGPWKTSQKCGACAASGQTSCCSHTQARANYAQEGRELEAASGETAVAGPSSGTTAAATRPVRTQKAPKRLRDEDDDESLIFVSHRLRNPATSSSPPAPPRPTVRASTRKIRRPAAAAPPALSPVVPSPRAPDNAPATQAEVEALRQQVRQLQQLVNQVLDRLSTPFASSPGGNGFLGLPEL
ncbi:MAG: hypothetical protein M4579_006220 [Chaenotheca gracillima]|nr:MAG: hypothetical protein M4579_006220 [Chaenotheca gracillima]